MDSIRDGTTILAWHFLPDDRRMQYPPHTLVEAGGVYRAKGALNPCRNGMHASERALDALRYAPGSVVCRVELAGEIIPHNGDKLCARERRVLWMADAGATLHEFACRCAEGALARERAAGRAPDPRSMAAIAAKRAWLRGEMDDAALAAARAAASAAASAAQDAVWDAASDAASDAARAAAWAAARAAQDAASDAASAAARAAQDAARAAQDADLTAMLLALAPEGSAQ